MYNNQNQNPNQNKPFNKNDEDKKPKAPVAPCGCKYCEEWKPEEEWLSVSTNEDGQRFESVTALFSDFAKFKGLKLQPIIDSFNGHLRNKYASLLAVIGALDELPKFNLGYFQLPWTCGGGLGVYCRTVVFHASGASIFGIHRITAKDRDAQTIGSTTTYVKRYALGAMFGFSAEEDDDGNKASGRGRKIEHQTAQVVDKPQQQRSEEFKHIPTGKPVPQKTTDRPQPLADKPPAPQQTAAAAPQATQQAAAPQAEKAPDKETKKLYADIKKWFGDRSAQEMAAGDIAGFLSGRKVADLTSEQLAGLRTLIEERVAAIQKRVSFVHRCFPIGMDLELARPEVVEFMNGRDYLDFLPDQWDAFEKLLLARVEDIATNEVPF